MAEWVPHKKILMDTHNRMNVLRIVDARECLFCGAFLLGILSSLWQKDLLLLAFSLILRNSSFLSYLYIKIF